MRGGGRLAEKSGLAKSAVVQMLAVDLGACGPADRKKGRT